jgi:hypothetical protein
VLYEVRFMTVSPNPPLLRSVSLKLETSSSLRYAILGRLLPFADDDDERLDENSDLE